MGEQKEVLRTIPAKDEMTNLAFWARLFSEAVKDCPNFPDSGLEPYVADLEKCLKKGIEGSDFIQLCKSAVSVLEKACDNPKEPMSFLAAFRLSTVDRLLASMGAKTPGSSVDNVRDLTPQGMNAVVAMVRHLPQEKNKEQESVRVREENMQTFSALAASVQMKPSPKPARKVVMDGVDDFGNVFKF